MKLGGTTENDSVEWQMLSGFYLILLKWNLKLSSKFGLRIY